MFPEVMANMITKDDMTMWDQFCASWKGPVELSNRPWSMGGVTYTVAG